LPGAGNKAEFNNGQIEKYSVDDEELSQRLEKLAFDIVDSD
jgi:hypothetical protein